MNRKEQVKKAIHMQSPEYVPLFYMNGDKSGADIIQVEVVRFFMGENRDATEWGFKWERLDKNLTLGQPKEPVIKEWEDLKLYKMPDPYDKTRFSEAETVMKEYGRDRYYMASLVLTGFTNMTFIRGFNNVFEDMYLNREELDNFADMIFGFEEAIIKQVKEYGFDAISLWDDWGTQDNLMISPALWREIFKPRYKRQIELAHHYGLDVFFHCCGYIYDIIPDLIEIGLDILNLGQPNVYDIKKLGRDFGGKICFVMPISYQTTSLTGTKEDIYKDAKSYIDNLGCFNGGLIGYIEDYSSMGMTRENLQSCINSFREQGRY